MQFRLPWPPKRSQQRQHPGTCLRGREGRRQARRQPAGEGEPDGLQLVLHHQQVPARRLLRQMGFQYTEVLLGPGGSGPTHPPSGGVRGLLGDQSKIQNPPGSPSLKQSLGGNMGARRKRCKKQTKKMLTTFAKNPKARKLKKKQQKTRLCTPPPNSLNRCESRLLEGVYFELKKKAGPYGKA